MSTKVGRDEGSYWRVDFIQPPVAHDDRCIMLYGEQGEIVGPLTMELAEAWLIRFDIRREVPGCNVECEPTNQPQPGRRFDQVLRNLKISPEFKEIHS
jgi:hypothetical protein